MDRMTTDAVSRSSLVSCSQSPLSASRRLDFAAPAAEATELVFFRNMDEFVNKHWLSPLFIFVKYLKINRILNWLEGRHLVGQRLLTWRRLADVQK